MKKFFLILVAIIFIDSKSFANINSVFSNIDFENECIQMDIPENKNILILTSLCNNKIHEYFDKFEKFRFERKL